MSLTTFMFVLYVAFTVFAIKDYYRFKRESMIALKGLYEPDLPIVAMSWALTNIVMIIGVFVKFV